MDRDWKPGQRSHRHPGDEKLRSLYVDERLSIRQVAQRLGVEATTVRHWLRVACIATRSISVAKRGTKPAAHAVAASVRARRRRELPGREGQVGYRWRRDGYVLVQAHGHPQARSGGYVLEHRLVMEQKLGRYLLPHEDVHHLDGIRHNNTPENLELLASRADHLRDHYVERSIDPSTGRFLPKKR